MEMGEAPDLNGLLQAQRRHRRGADTANRRQAAAGAVAHIRRLGGCSTGENEKLVVNNCLYNLVSWVGIKHPRPVALKEEVVCAGDCSKE